MAVVGAETHQKLSGIAAGNLEVLEEAVGLRELNREQGVLTDEEFSQQKAKILGMG